MSPLQLMLLFIESKTYLNNHHESLSQQRKNKTWNKQGEKEEDGEKG